MTTPKATKLTAEQLEALRVKHTRCIPEPWCEVNTLLAHITALEGEVATLREKNQNLADEIDFESKVEAKCDALQTALREVMSRTRPRLTGWSEPTARALKGLGL